MLGPAALASLLVHGLAVALVTAAPPTSHEVAVEPHPLVLTRMAETSGSEPVGEAEATRVEARSAPPQPSSGIVRRAKPAPRPSLSRSPPAVPDKKFVAPPIVGEATAHEISPDAADPAHARTAAAVPSGPAEVRGGGARPVFGESDVDGVAAPGERVRPRYPARARQVGREADVDLSVLIEADGAVSEVVLARSGGEDFDREAIEAVKRERWKPATRAGVPVASRVHFRVRFRLD